MNSALAAWVAPTLAAEPLYYNQLQSTAALAYNIATDHIPTLQSAQNTAA